MLESRGSLNKIKKTAGQLANHFRALLRSKKCRKFIIILFVVQAVILALSVKIGLPPDELFHIRFIEYFATHGFDPFIGTQKDSFSLGELSRTPEYLYQYLMSLIYRIIPFGVYGTYMTLRFLSIGLSAASLFLLAKLGDKLKIPVSVTNFSLLLLSNSAQFLFLSASVNSDLLVWFMVLACLIILVSFLHNNSLKTLFFLAGLVGLGMVTKRTFMPIGAMVAVGAVVKAFTVRELLFKQLKKPDVYLWLSIGFFVLGFGLFAERVGMNLVQYQQIKPACMDLHTKAECIENGVERRNLRIRESNIVDVENYNLVEYGFGWSYLTVSYLVGTQGWNGGVVAPVALNVAVLILSIAGLAASVIEIRARSKDKLKFVRLAIYFGSLVFIVYNFWFNYQVYQRSNIPGLALQGRYILPTATVFLLTSCYYVYKHIITKPNLRITSAIVLLAFMLYGSGLFLVLSDNFYTDNVFKPRIIFDRSDLISEHEPSI